MKELLTNPLLMLVALPLLAGFVCVALPPRFQRTGSLLSVIVSAIAILLAWPVFARFRGPSPVAPLLFPLLGGRLAFRVDVLCAWTLLAIAVFSFLVALYSLSFMRGRQGLRTFDASLLWTLGLGCGAVLANDLILLLVFWGLLGVTLYLMVGVGGSEASAAAKKAFIVVGGSDCFLMLGIGIVWFLTGATRMDHIRIELAGGLPWAAFLCFAVAAFAKAGAMPVHSWVPDCGEKAPIPVSAFLPASLDKLLGIYLLARAALGLFSLTPAAHSLLMLIGAGTVICAVMMALVQHDLKRLLSYHAVSQVGYMVLGIGSGTAIGIAGGLFHMLNNAIYKSCLFLCAGSVEKQTGTTDMDKLGGLARSMPLTFASCLTASLAISGVPPLNGFFSKWMVYQGIIESGRGGGGGAWILWLAAAMLGSALTLASFVKVLHAVFLCKPSDALAGREIREPKACMWMPTVGLAFLCVLFGVAAYRLPLAMAVLPSVGVPVAFLGNWQGGEAALLLAVAYLLGLAAYRLSTARKPRECETYIGGEIMSEVRRPDPAQGVEVTGVDFYRSIEDLSFLRGIYRAARNKAFDLYDVGIKVVFYGVELLRAAHTGNLLLYLTWFFVGLVVILGCLLGGGRLP